MVDTMQGQGGDLGDGRAAGAGGGGLDVPSAPPAPPAAEDVTSGSGAAFAVHEEKKVEFPEDAGDEAAEADAEDRPPASLSPAKAKALPGSGKEGADDVKGTVAPSPSSASGDPAPTSPEPELSREDQANCVSSWLLLYLSPLLKLGATKVLDASDVGPPSRCDRAKACYDGVHARWIAEVGRTRVVNEANKRKHQARLDALPADASKKMRAKVGTFRPAPPNLAIVLWRSFGYWRVWYAVALYILSALLQFLPVLILNDLVRYFESPDRENFQALLGHPWGDVAGLFVFPLLVSLLQTRSQVILNHCAVFIRTSVSTLLFSKALAISAAGRAQTSTGQVVNMVS